MSPKLARCMANLARVKEGDTVLDPFCGTGGILIEAGLIGCKVIGCDIDWKMKKGTATNLEYAGITDYKTHVVDVRELEMYEEVDAVVTDPLEFPQPLAVKALLEYSVNSCNQSNTV